MLRLAYDLAVLVIGSGLVAWGALTSENDGVQDRALTTSWLAAKLGTQSGRIEAMRRAGQLYAIRRPGEQDYLYPSWQFDEHGRPLPFVERLIRTAREAGLDDRELEAVLNRRAGLVGGKRVVDLIGSGAEEHVLDVVAAARPRQASS